MRRLHIFSEQVLSAYCLRCVITAVGNLQFFMKREWNKRENEAWRLSFNASRTFLNQWAFYEWLKMILFNVFDADPMNMMKWMLGLWFRNRRHLQECLMSHLQSRMKRQRRHPKKLRVLARRVSRLMKEFRWGHRLHFLHHRRWNHRHLMTHDLTNLMTMSRKNLQELRCSTTQTFA